MKRESTPKQIEARAKNFAKFRLRGVRKQIRSLGSSKYCIRFQAKLAIAELILDKILDDWE